MKIQKSMPGEQIIFVKHPSGFILVYNLIPLLVAIVALIAIFYMAGVKSLIVPIVLIAIGILISVIIILNWLRTIYTLTNKRVSSSIGIFGSKKEEIFFEDVQSIDSSRTFWGTILGYGTIIIEAAGQNNNVRFDNIQNFKNIEEQISDLTGVGTAS